MVALFMAYASGQLVISYIYIGSIGYYLTSFPSGHGTGTNEFEAAARRIKLSLPGRRRAIVSMRCTKTGRRAAATESLGALSAMVRRRTEGSRPSRGRAASGSMAPHGESLPSTKVRRSA